MQTQINDRLSPIATALLYLTAVLFALVGLVLFLVPAYAAANFAWKISPMVAMTMGGWYLGSAALAALAARNAHWHLIGPTALYVLVFSISEILVLVAHAGNIIASGVLTIPYITMLVVAAISSVVAWIEWLRSRPVLTDTSGHVPAWAPGVTVGFVVFVFFLAAFAFSGHSVGLTGVIFPEPLSLFTLHSFGAFYFSLATGALLLLRLRGSGALSVYVQGGLVLIALITVAAFAFWSSFNLAAHPFQSVYVGVYLVAFVIALSLWRSMREEGAVSMRRVRNG